MAAGLVRLATAVAATQPPTGQPGLDGLRRVGCVESAR